MRENSCLLIVPSDGIRLVNIGLENNITECILICENTRECQSISFRSPFCVLIKKNTSTSMLLEDICIPVDYSERIQGKVKC